MTPSTGCRTSKKPLGKWGLGLFIVILTLGSVARLYRLDEKSLWSDEVATIATSQGRSIDPEAYTLHGKRFDPVVPVPASIYKAKALSEHDTVSLSDVLNVLRDNVHPPLFFYLSQRWTAMRNSLSPGVLREPAALFGILDILFIFWLALQWMKLPAVLPFRLDSAYTPGSENALGASLNSTAVPAHTQSLSQTNVDFRTDGESQCQRYLWTQPLQRGFALLSSAFMALAAYQVDHAQDARQYTLLVLLALLATGVALGQIRNQGRVWPAWLGLSVVLAAGFYTQYFFGLFIVYIGLLLLVLGPKNRSFLLKGLASLTLTGLLCLPWLPWFRVQLTFFKLVGHYTAGLWNPLRLPEKLWRTSCEFFMPDNPIGKWLPLVVLLAVAYTVWRAYRQRKHAETIDTRTESALHRTFSQTKTGGIGSPATREVSDGGAVVNPPHPQGMPWALPISPVVTGLLLWLIVVIGGQVVIDLIKQTHTATIMRYLVLASPACYLLMAYALVWLWQQAKNQWQRGLLIGLTALMLGLMAGDTVDYLFHTHTSSDEFKQAAAHINADYRVGDVLLVSKSGAMAVGMALYLHRSLPMLGIDVPNPAALRGNTPLMNQIGQAIAGHSRVWLVFSHAATSTENRLGKRLEQAGYRKADFYKVPGVKVLLWEK